MDQQPGLYVQRQLKQLWSECCFFKITSWMIFFPNNRWGNHSFSFYKWSCTLLKRRRLLLSVAIFPFSTPQLNLKSGVQANQEQEGSYSCWSEHTWSGGGLLGEQDSEPWTTHTHVSSDLWVSTQISLSGFRDILGALLLGGHWLPKLLNFCCLPNTMWLDCPTQPSLFYTRICSLSLSVFLWAPEPQTDWIIKTTANK